MKENLATKKEQQVTNVLNLQSDAIIIINTEENVHQINDPEGRSNVHRDPNTLNF